MEPRGRGTIPWIARRRKCPNDVNEKMIEHFKKMRPPLTLLK
jgi:hypothetical protein